MNNIVKFIRGNSDKFILRFLRLGLLFNLGLILGIILSIFVFKSEMLLACSVLFFGIGSLANLKKYNKSRR